MKNISNFFNPKTIIYLSLFLLISKNSFSQADKNQSDSIVIKAIQRSLDLNMFEYSNGAIILKVYKKDSTVNVSLMYQSYKKFKDSDFKYLSKAINKAWNFSKIPPFELIVPIYLIPVEECCIKEKDKDEVTRELESLKRKGYRIYEKIVELELFQAQK